MRYDERTAGYIGDWLTVPDAVFERVLLARTAAGQQRDLVLDDLSDELAWSLDVPGVIPSARALQADSTWMATVTPWPLRFRVAIVHADEAAADELQFVLERAGMRAPAFVARADAGPRDLRGHLALAPSVCVLGPTSAAGAWLPWMQRWVPQCRFAVIDTAGKAGTEAANAAPAGAAASSVGQPVHRVELAADQIAQVVRTMLIAGSAPHAQPSDDARAITVLRSRLLRMTTAEQEIRALAYQGWARSLVRRSRRTRGRAAMLREQAQARRHERRLAREGTGA